MKTQPELILLIDDDDDDNFFHRRAIKKSGLICQVDICMSGDYAMDYLTNQGEYTSRGTHFIKPDLIFLDINMPRVDGWEFLNRYAVWIDNNQRYPATVIVMLSTSTHSADIQRAKVTPHVKQYVEKPLKPERVSELVKEHFPDTVT